MALPRYITLDGEQVIGSSEVWLGDDQRLAVGVFPPKGHGNEEAAWKGFYVERLGKDSYKIIEPVEREVLSAALKLMQHAI